MACFDLCRGAKQNLHVAESSPSEAGGAGGEEQEDGGQERFVVLINAVSQQPLHREIQESCTRLQTVEARCLVDSLSSFRCPVLLMRGAVKHCDILSNILHNALLLLSSIARTLERLDSCPRDTKLRKKDMRMCEAKAASAGRRRIDCFCDSCIRCFSMVDGLLLYR